MRHQEIEYLPIPCELEDGRNTVFFMKVSKAQVEKFEGGPEEYRDHLRKHFSDMMNTGLDEFLGAGAPVLPAGHIEEYADYLTSDEVGLSQEEVDARTIDLTEGKYLYH